MPTQAEKAHAFRALHTSTRAFVIPNPWDVGSARLLEQLGFEALATTSSGFATSRGQVDGQPGRDAVIAHAAELAAATAIPVTGDLENGFGDAPEDAAETIRRAAAAGLVGGSIEDFSGRSDQPLYELAHAKERVRAAVEAARGLGFPFTLTARAEGLLRNALDLRDTIVRLQAFQEAGADVLFAPALRSAEEVATVVREVDRPLNVLALVGGLGLNVAELEALGVKRISVGGLLANVAYGAVMHAATELKESGTFSFAAEAARARDVRKLLRR
jgi:2-methylisocitrate lyase-like PEP mutase family enzyme